MQGIQLSLRFSEEASRWLRTNADERLVGHSESKRLQMSRSTMRDIVYELVEQAASNNTDVVSLPASQKEEIERMIRRVVKEELAHAIACETLRCNHPQTSSPEGKKMRHLNNDEMKQIFRDATKAIGELSEALRRLEQHNNELISAQSQPPELDTTGIIYNTKTGQTMIDGRSIEEWALKR